MTRKESFLNLLPRILILGIICTLTFWVYGEVRHHQFLNFDDNEYVTENRQVKNGPTLESVEWAFGFTGVSYWHPLTWISHMVDCRYLGLVPGHHLLVNLIIHICNALLLFLIIMRMTGAPYKAALAALLFAVHPVNVESVAWIAERKNVLSVFFLMASLYAYLRYTEKKRMAWYAAVLVFYSLGLLSKTSILVFPFLLLVLDYWPLGRIGSPTPHASAVPPGEGLGKRVMVLCRSATGWLILEKVPLAVLSLVSALLSMLSMAKFHIVVSYDLLPFGLRVRNLFVSIVEYLFHILWPVELAIFYPFPRAVPAWHFALALGSLLLLTLLVFLLRKSRPWLLAGWLWFLIALAPAGGLVQAGLWPAMANRFMYLPMIGIFIMGIWEGDERLKGRYDRLLKGILCVALLAYFAALTRIQVIYYTNSYTLFKRAIEVTADNFVAYNNVGDALMSLNRVEEAKAYFSRAIALNPRYDEAYNNYGLCLAGQGDYEGAGEYFTRAVAVNPKLTAAYVNLGVNQHRRGAAGEARVLLEKALALDPTDGNALNNLGAVLASEGQIEAALRHYQAAATLHPTLVQAKINLAEAYERLRLYPEALAVYEGLIKLMPENRGNIYYRMAGLSAQQDRFTPCADYLDLAQRYGMRVRDHVPSDKRFEHFRKTSQYRQWREGRAAGGR